MSDKHTPLRSKGDFKPIKGDFRVLVVPEVDIRRPEVGGLPIVTLFESASGEPFRAVADAWRGNVGANFWAFSAKERARVVANLRALAAWLDAPAAAEGE